MKQLVSTLLLCLVDVSMTCYMVGKSWLGKCWFEDVKDLILFLPVKQLCRLRLVISLPQNLSFPIYKMTDLHEITLLK